MSYFFAENKLKKSVPPTAHNTPVKILDMVIFLYYKTCNFLNYNKVLFTFNICPHFLKIEQSLFTYLDENKTP
jgi:hypothetical protein